MRRLHRIVPKFVQILDVPGHRRPLVRVDNSEINANGVIDKIEKALFPEP